MVKKSNLNRRARQLRDERGIPLSEAKRQILAADEQSRSEIFATNFDPVGGLTVERMARRGRDLRSGAGKTQIPFMLLPQLGSLSSEIEGLIASKDAFSEVVHSWCVHPEPFTGRGRGETVLVVFNSLPHETKMTPFGYVQKTVSPEGSISYASGLYGAVYDVDSAEEFSRHMIKKEWDLSRLSASGESLEEVINADLFLGGLQRMYAQASERGPFPMEIELTPEQGDLLGNEFWSFTDTETVIEAQDRTGYRYISNTSYYAVRATEAKVKRTLTIADNTVLPYVLDFFGAKGWLESAPEILKPVIQQIVESA